MTLDALRAACSLPFGPAWGAVLETEAPSFGETIEKDAVLDRVVSPYTFEELEGIRNPVPQGIMNFSNLTRTSWSREVTDS